MEYDLNLTDGGLVALVIVIVNQLKKRVSERWIPVLPLAVAAVLAGFAVIEDAGGWPGMAVFVSRTIIEALKVGFSAMGLFKLYKTTLKGE